MIISGEFLAFLIVGSFFATIILVSFFKTRKAERMAMWASGRDLKDQRLPSSETDMTNLLKYGLLMAGLGFGLVVGEFLHRVMFISQEAAYFSMALLFGGVGLLLSYTILKGKEGKDARKG